MLLGTLAASDSVISAGEFSYSTLCFNKTQEHCQIKSLLNGFHSRDHLLKT